MQSVAGPSRPQEYNPVPPATNVDNASASGTVDGPGHNRPAQKKVCDELETVNKKIADFHVVKQTIGLSDDNEKQLKDLMNQKTELEKRLHRLISIQNAQKKFRSTEKRKMEELVLKYPEVGRKHKSKG